ncbi:serine hydrolase domain-containing protein [Chryseolinea sp. H1M3-3]|uniref:serine hydrolase domain-containing protein n=1 Tax=Chryseolinea sp. H1M3-3 TaxID=3034144 RepID=UPI0023EAA63C|nr:serine hydrolase domain-containing protein [Chryseolinea sp. H1M3-3]
MKENKTATVKKKIAPTPPKKANPLLQELLQDYNKEINSLALETNTPGAAIAVVHDSSIVFLKSYGVKRAGSTDSVDVNTVFRIASVSKCFAAFLTGILVEDSVLSWDNHVIDYVPNFKLSSPEETQRLSIKNVLSHTTGLPYHAYTNMVEEGIALDTMLSWLKKIKLVSKVGDAYSYQNVAYSVIGPVMQAATGKTYESLMQEKVFGPLKMNTASIDYASIMQNPNVAKPHLRRSRQWKPAKITDTYYNVAPAGGINASISDMAQWMIALLGNREDIITRATLHHLYSPMVKARSKNRNYGRMHRLSDSFYGLGWRILYYPNDTLIYHGGYVNGYRSEVAINPKDKIAVCILANAPGELADNGIPLFFDLFNTRRDSINAWEEKNRIKFLGTPAIP